MPITEQLLYKTDKSSQQRCSIKKLLVKIRNIHGKTPVLKFLLNKAAAYKACNFIKRDSNTDVFLWILRNF